MIKFIICHGLTFQKKRRGPLLPLLWLKPMISKVLSIFIGKFDELNKSQIFLLTMIFTMFIQLHYIQQISSQAKTPPHKKLNLVNTDFKGKISIF